MAPANASFTVSLSDSFAASVALATKRPLATRAFASQLSTT
jgi:hypothetical protein